MKLFEIANIEDDLGYKPLSRSEDADLAAYVRNVQWPADLQANKNIAHHILSKMQRQRKAEEFHAKVDMARTPQKVQELIFNIILAGGGDPAMSRRRY